MLAIRVVLAIVALVAAGWLVVAERGARAQAELEASAFGPEAPDAAQAARLRDRALRWSPDEQPWLTYGLLLGRTGDREGAVRSLRGVTRREPDNADAWRLLAPLADPPLAALARRRLTELVAPVP